MEKIRLQKFFTDNKIMSRRASEKVILANGGFFEKTVNVNGRIINRYWINIQ